ncbi:MAG: hypothetical protein HC887_12405 [Desulfobacteraceae bacterium]|nr:hypothetical protein [Desulfobacteraceae bacterium]
MSVPDNAEIIGCLEHGDFLKARRILERAYSNSEQIQKLKNSLDTPIKIGIYFQFQKLGQIPSEFFPVDASEMKEIILSHKDNYRLKIMTHQPGMNLFCMYFKKIRMTI